MELSGAPSLSATTFVIGLSELSAPFKQGVFVPFPDWTVNFNMDVIGFFDFVATWPTGVPAGIPLLLQVWFADAGAPAGYAASNALGEVTP